MTEPLWSLTRKKEILTQRSGIMLAIRVFFTERGYIEVETPHRIPANAPELHIDAISSDNWFLHTSPEIAMKRMLAAGYEHIFQLCRVWRSGERGQQHLPEFSMLEWYRVGVDYTSLMEECEELLRTLAPAGYLSRDGKEIDISAPWERLTVSEAFERYASKSLEEAIAQDFFEEILSEEVELHLGKDRPTFLIEYPASMAALARTKPSDSTVAERFELYIDGIELANAFSELTDPTEQKQRFVQDEVARRKLGKPEHPLPELFLSELEAMPDAAGIALGVDRLIMLLTGAKSIDEVIAFTPEEL